MRGLERTFAQLDAVSVAAADPGAAYLIRSRLRRALLSCARAIAEMQGFEKPLLPGRWAASSTAPPEIARVATLCRRIHQNAAHLCKPSESFDIRWERGWSVLAQDLAELRIALEDLPDPSAR